MIVLTGASSFIGRHLLGHLLGAGHDVVGLARNPVAAHAGREVSRCRTVQVDLDDAEGYRRLPARADAIVHIAGVSPVGGTTVLDVLRCNVSGMARLVSYAHRAGVRRFVHTSTISVHGRIESTAVDETTPSIEPDVYGASKLVGERILAQGADAMSVLALRLPGTLGIGAHRAWIPTVAERLVAGVDVAIYNPDAPFNNAVHVDDLGRLICGTLDISWKGFRALPLGAAGMTTVLNAVTTLKRELKSPSAIEIRPAVKPGFTISSKAAEEEFGYAPMHISEMLVHYANEVAR